MVVWGGGREVQEGKGEGVEILPWPPGLSAARNQLVLMQIFF